MASWGNIGILEEKMETAKLRLYKENGEETGNQSGQLELEVQAMGNMGFPPEVLTLYD